jgi:cellulose synthase/poly-beta-1,6-N-acetylglucosamine synthase-like glycosyltransferase
MKVLFWLSAAWLLYVFVGYPLVLWVIGRFRQTPYSSSANFEPLVSVLISARNEEKDIAWKIKETLKWNYPPDQLEILVASDASEDRTDEILASIRDSRLRVLRNSQRAGKNSSLNRLAALARGGLLFFTDANSHIAADCLRKMVRHFADARVGCVTGWEREEDVNRSGMSAGGGSYLGYESLINSLESVLGSVLVCDGSVFCIRRELFATLQPDLANDLELPLHIGSRGYAVLYEPAAYSTEKNTSSPQEEFRRRRRICGQGILALWRLRGRIRGLRAWQFASRKLLRWFAFVPMVLALALSAALARQPFFGILLILQLAFYFAAGAGWYLVTRTRFQSRVVALPFYFLLVNLGAIAGFLDACRGRRFSVWEIPSLSRGRAQ